MPIRHTPLPLLLVAVFFAVATLILLGVGTALMSPGSRLEALWSLYPERRSLLMPYRLWLGPIFLILALAMAATSAGCFLRRNWGWVLAVVIFAGQVLGDAVQLLMGRYLEGAVGIAAGGAILFYLGRPAVRQSFG
ncbi:MAG TPA: hypothetical protein VGL55_08040 [Steroidobacteraceae bacterium]|jgi:small-conductance mechanosensitive channel